MIVTTQSNIADSVLSDELLALSAGGFPVLYMLQEYQNRAWASQSEKQKRIELEKDRAVTVGISSASYAETTLKTDNTTITQNGLTAEVMDLTGHPDRAVIRLKNDLGFDVYLTRFQIMGNRILQSNGKAGSLILDLLKHDDDIRRNGERVKTISNDYIFDATQVATIADYWYKLCGQKKHVYALQIPGSALWYEPGDWYTLSLGGAGQNEYISATVEVLSVSVDRSNGGIGSTLLIVRECMESWSKTTLYTARLVTGASPKRRPNQSNTLIVASSSFDGTYDYRCDGTADDVQIQAAIDYAYQTWGGGRVELSFGRFNITTQIEMRSGITLIGKGENTILSPSTGTKAIYTSGITNVEISKMTIDYAGGDVAGAISIDTPMTGIIFVDNVHIKGITPAGATNTAAIVGSSTNPNITIQNCLIDDIIATSGNKNVYGIWAVNGCYNNRIGTMTGFGTGSGYGLISCKKCQQNDVVGASTAKYGIGPDQSYADDGTTYPCDDTPNGGFNS